MAAAQGSRIQGPPWYYQRVSVEEQNNRLRERLRRKAFDLDAALAKGSELKKENDALRLENAVIRRENEGLREENARLKSLQRPAWIKPNLHPEVQRNDVIEPDSPPKLKKKIGAKFGHPAHKRTVPKHIDRHAELMPDHCPSCQNKLPHPNKWHTHTQIDRVEPLNRLTEKHNGPCPAFDEQSSELKPIRYTLLRYTLSRY